MSRITVCIVSLRIQPSLLPGRGRAGGYFSIKVTGVLVVPFKGFMTILSKWPREESVRKLSLLLLKFAVPVIFSLLLLHELVPLSLGVEMNLGHAHKTRFWYLSGVFSKFSNEQPRHLHRGVPPRALLAFHF